MKTAFTIYFIIGALYAFIMVVVMKHLEERTIRELRRDNYTHQEIERILEHQEATEKIKSIHGERSYAFLFLMLTVFWFPFFLSYLKDKVKGR